MAAVGHWRLLLVLVAWSAWLGCEAVNMGKGGRMVANDDYAYDNATTYNYNGTTVWYNGTYMYYVNGTFYSEDTVLSDGLCSRILADLLLPLPRARAA